ncbi:MAG: anthranilate synthase component I family protein [Planctomycetota bacterium]|nr:MAG: anthranilate synthase component I family protein [Planctomycetota bacterium]
MWVTVPDSPTELAACQAEPLPSQWHWRHAVACLNDRSELICLPASTAGRGAWTYVCAPDHGRNLRHLEDLPCASEGFADTRGTGWPAAITGGWLLQADYGLPVGKHAASVTHAPLSGRAVRLDAWLAWDPSGQGWLCGPDRDARQALMADLARSPETLPMPVLTESVQAQWNAASHCAKVEAIRQAITAGVCFQANLTVPFRAQRKTPQKGEDLALFLALHHRSPAPYAAFWRQPQRSICSHSPECFLQGDSALLRSDPIKGTRTRVAGQEAQQRHQLFHSSKDRAELAMIVDLVRNDLGRIAEVGSVRVEQAAALMDLDYVHHLVARVTAVPRADTQIIDWLAAAYPAGSITGAPKIAVMDLLDGLEGVPRGPYCGTFGWYGQRCLSLAVAIRTVVLTPQEVVYHAGGGIVIDSQPESEWQEVLGKAQRMAECFPAQ